MSEGYKNTNARYAIGSAATGATLTAAYSGNISSSYPIGGNEQAIIACAYTPKAAQSNRYVTIKPEFSYDNGTTWFPLSIGSDAAVTSNVVVTTLYDNEFKMVGATGGTTYYQRIPFELADYGVGYRPLLRLSIKEDGSADFGTAKVILILSGE